MTWRRRAALILIFLPVAYLVAANGLLNSGLLPRLISANPDKLLMRWGSAWSPWPGRVYVRDFHVRAGGSAGQWEVTVDRATTQVVLGALFDRTFQTKWVIAEGVQFRLQPPLPPEEKEPEVVALFPPIEPIDGALVKQPLIVLPEQWNARLDGITVHHVREVWVGAYRMELDGEVTQGRIWVHPERFLQIGPASLNVGGGRVFQGTTQVATNVSGEVHATIDVPEMAKALGDQALQFTDGRARLTGEIASVEFLGFHIPFDLEGGRARVLLDVAMTKGAPQPGSRIEVTGEEASARLGDYRLRGAWTLGGSVVEERGAKQTTLALAIRPFYLTQADGTKVFQSEGVKATLSATDLVLGQEQLKGALSFELTQTDSFPLKRLNTYVGGDSFRIDGGRATLGGQLKAGPGSPRRGALTLKTTEIMASLGRMKLRGDAIFELDLTRLRLGRKSATLSGSSITLTDVSATSAHSRTHGWTGRIDLVTASVALRPKVRVDAEITCAFRDARPFLALFGDSAGLPRWTNAVFAAENLRLSGTLGVDGSRLVLRDLRADGDGLRVQGQLEAHREKVSGIFLVTVRGVSVGLKLADGKVKDQVLDPLTWYRAQVAEANGEPLGR